MTGLHTTFESATTTWLDWLAAHEGHHVRGQASMPGLLMTFHGRLSYDHVHHPHVETRLRLMFAEGVEMYVPATATFTMTPDRGITVVWGKRRREQISLILIAEDRVR